jgi:nucleotide-binding universal stress UspA family protein
MFAEFLVPLDGTPAAEAALPLATALASAMHGGLRLVRVLDRDADPAAVVQTGGDLARVAAGLRHPGVEVETEVHSGSVVDGILVEAERHGVELVVMATHGRQGLERVRLGSVTEQVLARSPRPVVVVYAGQGLRRLGGPLLVPVDGSPGAEAALPVARALALALGARVVLVQVVPPLVRYGRGRFIEPHVEADERAAAEAYLEGLANGFREIGVAAETRAVIGPVAETILALAGTKSPDLIVMGTHAATGITRTLLGSVADENVRKAQQPVVLVRRPDQGAAKTPHRAESMRVPRPARSEHRARPA